jgi:hypothetical protein
MAHLSFARIALLAAFLAGAAGLQRLPDPTVASANESPDAPEDCAHFLPYSPDPQHIWNRLHRQLLERRDRKGQVWGCDEIDPLLWRETTHILVGDGYSQTLRLLDEFTSTHAERLIRDPLSRAILQHDLWAVFDWLVATPELHIEQRAQLERRLAAIIKAVALTPEEIERLPDNYSSLRGTVTADGLALPDLRTGWVLLGRDDGEPVAPFHSFAFPRSLFLVYLKLPPNGPSAETYIEAMRSYSRQFPLNNDCMMQPCSPPQFPAGTELALVRRALLIDIAGRPAVSPITESVQLRRYREIPTVTRFDFGKMQQPAEFQFTRRTLSQCTLGMRRLGQDEPQFRIFSSHGFDMEGPFVVLQSCGSCHQGAGAISFTSYSRVHFERQNLFIMMHAAGEPQEGAAALAFLRSRGSWKIFERLRPDSGAATTSIAPANESHDQLR